MKRVGLRNKIISRHWNGLSDLEIKKQLRCTKQTIDKWLKPLRDTLPTEIPKQLISLGWSPGEIIRVLKIEEDELKNTYNIEFKPRDNKLISDEELIEFIDNETSTKDIAEITNQTQSYISRRLNDIGWIKPPKS